MSDDNDDDGGRSWVLTLPVETSIVAYGNKYEPETGDGAGILIQNHIG